MFHLDLLAQVYLISLLVGGFFIVFNIVLGQIDHLAAHHHGFHLPSGHDAASGHGAVHGHIAGSHSVQHGVSHGHTAGGHNVHDAGTHGDLSTNGPQAWLGNYISISVIERLRRRLLVFVQGEDIPSRIGMFLISLLSPMRIAIWLTFFGGSGFFIERLFPWLSFLSLIPALIIAAVCTNIFNNLMGWTMDLLQSPDVQGQDDLIGKVAEVQTPMADNLIGEIVYTMDSGRANCAARPAKKDLIFKRGQHVMIVDIKDHIALVEPVNDSILLEDSPR